jgi:hypothetical protein
MDIQPVTKAKHHAHSRTLEQRNEERMQTSAAIIRSCQDTVRISRELLRESRAAVEKIRKARKR